LLILGFYEMEKAKIFLQSLVDKKELKDWCLKNDLSYHYIHKTLKSDKPPSPKYIKKMMHLIPPGDWFIEA
jgi:hypothetical protein